MDFNSTPDTSTVPIPAIIANFVSSNPRAAAQLLNAHADNLDAANAAPASSSGGDVPSAITSLMNATSPKANAGDNGNSDTSGPLVNREAVGQALNASQPNASDAPKPDAKSTVPPVISKMVGIGLDAPSDLVDMTEQATKPSVIKAPASDNVPVPSLAVPSNASITKVPLTPTTDNPDPLQAAVKNANDLSNTPDVPPPSNVPPVIASAMGKPDLSALNDIAAPTADESGKPQLHKSFLQKVEGRIPQILTALGIAGGGLEAAFSPNHEAPSAEMFQRTLEAAKNRAIQSRQLDIGQQKADTDEAYRKLAAGQFGLVPVSVPDPSDPNKTIQIMVQQKDAGKYAGAAVTAGGKERSATETNEMKYAIARLKSQADAGQFKTLVPGLNPDSGQYEMQKLDKNGKSMGFVPNSVVSSLVQKTSDTGEWKQMADGSYTFFPKQTISGPSAGQPTAPGTKVLSNAATSPNSSAASSANGGAPNTPAPNTPPAPRRFIQPPAPSGGGSNAQNSVIGFDKDGQQVFTAAADAPKYGLTQVRKVGQAEAEKVTNARSIMPTFNSNSPSDPGIIQLIDKLDKDGQLGVVASRWNEFLAGKVGAGNPDIESLRTKMGLAETALMQIHIGARGSSAMMEHFHNLVNSGNMDANTMRTGIVDEYHYIQSKAMLPSKPVAPANNAPGNGSQPNTNKYGFVPAMN